MNEFFSEKSRKVVECAQEEAKRLHHDYIGTEHLLLGIIRLGQSKATDILNQADIDPERYKIRY